MPVGCASYSLSVRWLCVMNAPFAFSFWQSCSPRLRSRRVPTDCEIRNLLLLGELGIFRDKMEGDEILNVRTTV